MNLKLVLCEQIIHWKWILQLLAKYGGPTKIKRLGKACVNNFARTHRARNPERVIDAIFAAIAGQSVQIAGAEYAELGVEMSTKDALLKIEHRKDIEAEVIELIEDIPQTQFLLSLPGVGPRSAVQILMTVRDMSDFPTVGHLASYTGLSPMTNQSGTSIMFNSLNRAGNKKLKNALMVNCSPLVGLRNQTPTNGEFFYETTKFPHRASTRTTRRTL